MVRRLVLASASPARLQLLRGAGLDPEVIVSNVAEDGLEALAPSDAVVVLARLKARTVADALSVRGDAGAIDPAAGPPLVVACDSLLEFDGEAWGKPASSQEVERRWQRMRGRSGLLHTGHCIIDCERDREVFALDTAVVHFGEPETSEIAAYAATAEAQAVAGPFTLEGLSAPWVERIEGNYGTITGLSMPVLRRLLRQLGVAIVDLWR